MLAYSPAMLLSLQMVLALEEKLDGVHLSNLSLLRDFAAVLFHADSEANHLGTYPPLWVGILPPRCICS